MYAKTIIPTFDSELDITDDWLAVTDPENELGEVATALFEHGRAEAFHPSDPRVPGEWVDVPVLTGLRVENIGVTEFHSRDWVIEVFGAKEVARIEDSQYDRVNS